MTRRKNQSKPNGHAGLHDRTNDSAGPEHFGAHGPAPASTARGGIPVHQDHAASVDVSGALLASAATFSTVAGKDRRACAEAAPPRAHGEHRKSARRNSHDTDAGDKTSPGEGPLPLDPGEFVEEIHRRVDLFQVWQKLLKSKDKKIKQRAVEKLTEMRYKGAAALAEDPQQIIIDMPGPKRD